MRTRGFWEDGDINQDTMDNLYFEYISLCVNGYYLLVIHHNKPFSDRRYRPVASSRGGSRGSK